MRLRLALVCSVSALMATGAAAQISGRVTDSTVKVSLKPPQNFSYEGLLIDGFDSDASPSGASYTSRSEINGQDILFVNGNATTGSYAAAVSRTVLDVTFTNSSREAIDATLRSTLLPAGFGLFVTTAGCAGGPVTSCSEAVGGPGFATLPNTPGNVGPLAFTSFNFDISLSGRSLFSLTGSISLIAGPDGNVLVTDIADAENVLKNFSLFTPADSPTAVAYVWDATDIDLMLGSIGAGESRVLSYTTTTTTFTRSAGADTCGLAAFSEFGDPVGRGGSIPPPDLVAYSRGVSADPCAGGGIDGLSLQRPSLFSLPAPTFENGVLSVQLQSTAPEPATWAMLVVGFGLAGTAQRRRRSAAA